MNSDNNVGNINRNEPLPLCVVPGISQRVAAMLEQKAGILGATELFEALQEGRLDTLHDLDLNEIKQKLERWQANNKMPLGFALERAREFAGKISALDSNIVRVEVTGALRRAEELVEQVSLIAVSNDTYDSLEAFLKLPEIAEVRKRWDYKADVTLQNGLKLEFITCFPEQLATAWALTTGTNEHRTQLRNLAYKYGYELSLGGFLKREDVWPAKDEEEVFRYLGLPYIPPELRNGNGEIEAIQKGEMSLDLVTLAGIKGDLHVHSNWGNGSATIEELARAATKKGYHYLLLADHAGQNANLDKLLQQRAEIFRVNDVLAQEGYNFSLLWGVEVEILPDGTLSLPDEILSQLEIVVAAIHSGLHQERKQITERFIKAMQNPHVDIVTHPTGRILNLREPADLFMLKIFVAARETGTALEISGNPDRLDLKAEHIQQALEEKPKLVISSGAHSPQALAHLEYGVLTARRGAARASEILNTLELNKLKEALK
jgi:DNA polymerase (family 10)